MPTLPNGRSVVRFGAFEADLSSGEVHKHGHKIKLQGQPFQVLVMLLGRPGKVIAREELRARLWPADTFVDFDTGLNSAIKKLRLRTSTRRNLYLERFDRHPPLRVRAHGGGSVGLRSSRRHLHFRRSLGWQWAHGGVD